MAGMLLAGALASLIALTGCAGDTTGPSTPDLVAVFGTLYVGEAVSDSNAIRVTRIRPIDQVYDPATAGVSDAVVTIEREGGAGPDTLALVAPGLYADTDSSLVVAPGTTYHLRVDIPGDRVLTATTVTPDTVVFTGEVPDSMAQALIQEAAPIFVEGNDPEQLWMVDVYCIENWQDARWIYPIGPDDGPQDFAEYGRDNGEPRHIVAYANLEDLDRGDAGYRIDFYSGMFAFYGRYDVQMMVIDDNIYSYTYRDHPEEHGGVTGGIGLFGSAQRKRWRIKVLEN